MNKPYSDPKQSEWIAEAQAHVLELHNKKYDPRLVHHNYHFTTLVVEQVGRLADAEQLIPEKREITLLAAWFANVGYLFNYQDYAHYSQLMAEKFLHAHEYPESLTKKIVQTILNLKKNLYPQDDISKVLSDAYTIASLFLNYEERIALLKLEWEFLLDRKMTHKEWRMWKLQRLLNTQLFTHSAKKSFESVLAHLIQNQKAQLDQHDPAGSDNGALATPRKRFGEIERKVPQRGIQTFFRTNYRNHINLSAIADNKANIMISVNTILVSVLITILSYRNITETTPMILLPVVLFLVTGLVSLIFAVLSARPKITSLNKKPLPPSEARRNIVFFGNFVNLDLDTYEKAMDDLFSDSELLYGNMTRDLYYLGKVLDKKYRYLTISYNVFMVGFITTVLTFLVIWLT